MDVTRAGTKLHDPETGVEAVVVRPPSEPVLEIRGSDEPVELGKRYTCQSCGAEVLVTRSGSADLACHGSVMARAEAKPLPSSD